MPEPTLNDRRLEIKKAVKGDPTIALLIAAEAAMHPKSVTRWLSGVRVRPNTVAAIVHAWDRLVSKVARQVLRRSRVK